MAERRTSLLTLRLIVVGLVLTGALAGGAIMNALAVTQGTEIVLGAQGYDPRAPLTGNFTQVTFAISNPSFDGNPAIVNKPGWQDVWVVIAPDGPDWKAVSASNSKPNAAPAGGYLIAAETRYSGGATVPLRYGIERIYLQQKEAERIAGLVRGLTADAATVPVKVVASLGSDKRLRLKGLIVQGKRMDFTWW